MVQPFLLAFVDSSVEAMRGSAEKFKGNLPPVVFSLAVGLEDLHQYLDLLLLPVAGGFSSGLDEGQELKFNKIVRFQSKQQANLLNLLVRLNK